MKALVCEVCSGNELVKDEGLYTCQYCGTKFTVEEMKNLFVKGTVDVKGTVKIDESNELSNLYELARRAKENSNYEDGSKYYDMILLKDASSWEAYFYSVYFKQYKSTIEEICSAINTVKNCLEGVLNLVKENVEDDDLRKKAVDEIGAKCIALSMIFTTAAKNHYEGIAWEVNHYYIQDYRDRALSSVYLIYYYGDTVINVMGEDLSELACSCWEAGINLHNIVMPKLNNKELHVEQIQKYTDKIKNYNPTYETPESTGACYIATCAYGTYDCPSVWILRRYRDFYLQKSHIGKIFVRIYYLISPRMVALLGNNKTFRAISRIVLKKLIDRLKRKGFSDMPYRDE